jgi:hypothetical protein
MSKEPLTKMTFSIFVSFSFSLKVSEEIETPLDSGAKKNTCIQMLISSVLCAGKGVCDAP